MSGEIHPKLIKKIADALINQRVREAERVWLTAPDQCNDAPDPAHRVLELYCDWRTACGAVQAAYERFGNARSAQRANAFAAYVAALDREESACRSYAAHTRLLESRPTDGGVVRRLRRRPANPSGRA
jgi:hypothetical protein